MWPPNAAAIDRLQQAYDAGQSISGGDASFYTHEIFEKSLMDQGMEYDDAHEAALAEYGVSRFSVYPLEVLQQFSALFNPKYLQFWENLSDE